MRRWLSTLVAAACLAAWLTRLEGPLGARAQEVPQYAGPKEDGFLLPNGWKLKPAGQHVPQSDLPLNIIPLSDNRRVLVATGGYNAHELSLIDLDQKTIIDRREVPQSWFGLAVSPEARSDLVVGRRGKHAARVPPGGRTSGRGEGIGGRGRGTVGAIALHGGRCARPSSQGPLCPGRRRRPDLGRGPGDPRGTEVCRGRHASLRRRPGSQRRAALRLRLGRAGRARVRAAGTPHRLPDRRRRASQPDRRPPRGRSDLRRVRLERLRLGDRHPARDRHRDDPHGAVPAGPGGQHAGCPGDRARRQDPLRGQRRQ